MGGGGTGGLRGEEGLKTKRPPMFNRAPGAARMVFGWGQTATD